MEAMGDERGGRVERKDKGREFASCKIEVQFEGIPFSNMLMYSCGTPVEFSTTLGISQKRDSERVGWNSPANSALSIEAGPMSLKSPKPFSHAPSNLSHPLLSTISTSISSLNTFKHNCLRFPSL